MNLSFLAAEDQRIVRAGTVRLDDASKDKNDGKPFMQATPSSASHCYHEVDELGNVIGTIGSGSVSQTDSYDAWGTVTYGGNIDQHLVWKGLFWNGDITGLYYVRNRWYDPEGGRFVSEDPAGFAGGLNQYAFANNDPVNGSDPLGLQEDGYPLETVQVTGVGCDPGYEYNFTDCLIENRWLMEMYQRMDWGQASADPGGGGETGAREKMQKQGTCLQDIAQAAWAGLGTALGLGAYKFASGFALLARSEAAWADEAVTSRFARNAAFLPGFTVVKMTQASGGSPNPLEGTSFARAYKYAKSVPWLGLGMEIGEAAVSCDSAIGK